MTETRILYQPEIVTSPGETLADLLDERNMSQAELAQRMGRPVNKINEIINGKRAITPETAIQLERVLGTPSAYWLNHEAHYQAYRKRIEEDQRFEQWYEWLEQMPIARLKELGVLPPIHNRGRNKNILMRAILNFFSISSPAEWDRLYGGMRAAYRQSMPDRCDPYATAAWLRLGEKQVEVAVCADYDRQSFRVALESIRPLTLETPEVFEPRLRNLCAASGVVLALVPEIPGARVSGAARWINGRPLIQMSLYGKTNDRFWFTFFHEAGHILKHSHQLVYLDDRTQGVLSQEEKEANEFAASILIPPKFEHELAALKSKDSVIAFAQQIQIHPGIVVGRLQYEKLIPRSHMNGLKDTFDWRDAVNG